MGPERRPASLAVDAGVLNRLIKPQTFTINAASYAEGDHLLQASAYAEGALKAIDAIERCRLPVSTIGSETGRIYHLTENQARSNFKRIWVDEGCGEPYLSPREAFLFRSEMSRFLSPLMEKLHEMKVEPGWMLLSRSGTTGNPIMVGQRLSRYAISDDVLRVLPGRVPLGFIYAFLFSQYGAPLATRDQYGATVKHLEAKHIAKIPLPLPGTETQERVHRMIVEAYSLRDTANELLDEADRSLHNELALSRFREEDIEYLHAGDGPRSFSVDAMPLGGRLDARSHVPIARSAVNKMGRAGLHLQPLGNLCEKVWIPGRFKREYVPPGTGVPYLIPSQLPLIYPYGMKAVSLRQKDNLPEYLLQEGCLLVSTDGTVGRVHPVSGGMVGWFASNNLARLFTGATDAGWLYAFLATPYGQHQLKKEIYGGVVDHITEGTIRDVLVPEIDVTIAHSIGDLVRQAFAQKDRAMRLEVEALGLVEALIEGRGRAS